MRRSRTSCAYCGDEGHKFEREHVIPRCLYPASKLSSRIQRITVPACRRCNNSWSDDEAHFRNVLLVAGEPNAVVRELWQTTAQRSFNEADGPRRLLDLIRGMAPVTIDGNDRWMIYPGHDDRVLRVIRKIVRGLSHFHGIESGISDNRVWADVLKYRIPPELAGSIQFHHRETDIIEYWYEAYGAEEDLSSAWLLRFFEQRLFIASVGR